MIKPRPALPAALLLADAADRFLYGQDCRDLPGDGIVLSGDSIRQIKKAFPLL